MATATLPVPFFPSIHNHRRGSRQLCHLGIFGHEDHGFFTSGIANGT